MDINYVGEHLWPGKIGNLLVMLSFVAALFSTFSFFRSSQSNDDTWKALGRAGFRLHSLAVLGIIATMFYMIVNHMFEYHYVWQHSSSSLPLRYMLSCFWEGQEGSFLLWTFWHVILGNILIKKSRDWEAPVMTIFSMVQVFLASMVLGVYIFGIKIGSNPFVLLREHPDMANLPFIQNANYLKFIDGRGLNPLLQNYWMTIHPPTLFLGFAATLIPFSYAIAALWKGRVKEWITPALPWTYFAIMVLGTGILMGGAWAYEALSFGGFWAWDPVENASLVPWLTLVGAAHLMLINKRKKATSMFSTFLLATLTFLLVLYSTYLTRSGVLGETSVHSFAAGMPGQLIIFMLFFLALTVFFMVKSFKKIKSPAEEESTWSREFWMLIGALVLFISAFQITFTTSIPVINKIFGSNLAPPNDPIEHYNSWQMPFAIIVTFLIAVGQYFKYKETDLKAFTRKIGLAFLIALILSGLIAWGLEITNLFYILLLFTSLFAVMSNLDYFIRILKGDIKKAGGAIAHVGFGLLILGALLSAGMQEVISVNTSDIDIRLKGDDEEDANTKNIMLAKNDTLPMGQYYVSYRGSKKEGINIYYTVDYMKPNDEGHLEKKFTLHPRIQTNELMGNVPEPDTRHYIDKDIFTHITYANLDLHLNDEEDKEGEYTQPEEHVVNPGDTIYTSSSYAIVEKLDKDVNKKKYKLAGNDIAVATVLKVHSMNQGSYTARPVMAIRANQIYPLDDEVEELGLKFSFTNLNPETGEVTIAVSERKTNQKDFIIMQAIVFPYINVLWAGCILMIIGTLIAVITRFRKNK